MIKKNCLFKSLVNNKNHTAPKVFVLGRRCALLLKNSRVTFFFWIGNEGSLVPTYKCIKKPIRNV